MKTLKTVQKIEALTRKILENAPSREALALYYKVYNRAALALSVRALCDTDAAKRLSALAVESFSVGHNTVLVQLKSPRPDLAGRDLREALREAGAPSSHITCIWGSSTVLGVTFECALRLAVLAHERGIELQINTPGVRHHLADVKVQSLEGLTVRAANLLIKAEIETLEDLVKFPADLIKIAGMGPKSKACIVEAAIRAGLEQSSSSASGLAFP